MRAAELKIGQMIETEIRQGAVDQHAIDLAADQYLEISVEQLDADVGIALIAPSGERLIEMDYRRGRRGVEPLEWVTPMAGRYLLEVRCSSAGENGGYRVTVDTVRQATNEDPARVRAEREYLLGNLAERERDPSTRQESLQRAVQHYRAGLALWRQAGDAEGQAKSLHNLGSVLERQADPVAALAAYSEAVLLWPDPHHRAESLENVGFIHLQEERVGSALEAFERALSLARKQGNLAQEAKFLRDIGRSHHQEFRPEEAVASYEQALEISRRLGSDREEAQCLLFLAQAHSDYGQSQKALEYALEAWEIARQAPARERGRTRWVQISGALLNTLGVTYQRIGLHDEALFFLEQAREQAHRLGQRQGEARTLTNIGWSHHFSGQPAKAITALEQALELQRKLEDRRAQAATHNNLGRSFQAQQQIPKALQHHGQALDLYRQLGDRPGETRALISTAKVLVSDRQPDRALALIDQTQGQVYNPVQQSWIYWIRARANQQKNHLEQALDLTAKAIAGIESRRSSILGIEQRAEFLAAQRTFFELQIELLMQIETLRQDGSSARALEISEQARARSLIELLERTRIGPGAGVDAALTARKEALQQRLNALELRRQNASEKQPPEKTVTPPISQLEEDIQTTLIEYQRALSQIRSADPRFSALTEPNLLTAEEIRANLDPDTLLLEYFLGEERSFLWSVSTTEVRGFELPPRSEIEDLARRAYEVLAARETWPAEETLSQRSDRIQLAERTFARVSEELSQILLGPIAESLNDQRLVIASDGALHFVPFAALPLPSAADPPALLISRHEIVHLPSIGVLQALRRETRDRPAAQQALFVLADPVFSPLDGRMSSSGSIQTATGPMSAPQGEERAVLDPPQFQRLRFSRVEAQSITALAPARQTTTVLDFAASREELDRRNLENYRILHFATHGILNSRYPELSALVLSLVDEQGKGIDGFLRLHDIYDLQLNADLVVLSACQTALGQQIRGEGLIGLTRGFMYAGSASVLASLWTVQDRATKVLMTRFYKSLFEQGKPPAAALRTAQLSLLSEPQFSAPYYWAAFALQGDWRPARQP